MRSLFYKSLLDATGIAACVLDEDGSICAISCALSQATGLGVGDKLELVESGAQPEVRCLNSKGVWVLDAVCLPEDGYLWLVQPIAAEGGSVTGVDGLIHTLRRELVTPLDTLTRSLFDLTLLLEGSEGAVTPLLDQVHTMRDEVLKLQGKALGYWSLFSANDCCPVRGDERVEPRELIEEALAPMSMRLALYLKTELDLGVVYGSQRWLVLALRTLVSEMVRQYGTQRLSCELRQCNNELLLTFQDIGMLTPGNQEPWCIRGRVDQVVDPLIDTERATSAVSVHGGVVRYNSGADIGRLIISLPTGAPGQEDIALLFDKTEAELMQMNACIKEDGDD
jgi:hypothetical protein